MATLCNTSKKNFPNIPPLLEYSGHNWGYHDFNPSQTLILAISDIFHP